MKLDIETGQIYPIISGYVIKETRWVEMVVLKCIVLTVSQSKSAWQFRPVKWVKNLEEHGTKLIIQISTGLGEVVDVLNV
jgi:hypothetical protein